MKTLFTLFLFALSFSHLSAQAVANAGADQEICILDTLSLTGSGLSPGDSGTYRWKELNNGLIVSAQNTYRVRITNMAVRTYELKVTLVKMGVTSYAYDTMAVTVNALPTFTFKGLPARCYYDGAINLTGSQIAIAHSGDKTMHDSDIRYYQYTHKNPSWINGGPVGSNPYIYDFRPFILNVQIPKTGIRDTFCYEYTDYKGCYNRECKFLRLNPNPVVELKQGIFCQRIGKITLDSLVMKPIIKTSGAQIFRCISVPSGSGVDPNTIITVDNRVTPEKWQMDQGNASESQKAGEYVIEYCFKDVITGCQSCDTTTVTVLPQPKLRLDAIGKQCINGSMVALDSFISDSMTGKRFPDATWECLEFGGSRDMSNSSINAHISNSVKSLKFFDPSVGTGQYLVKCIANTNGCPVMDSTVILVNGLPLIQIDVPDTVCYSDSAFTLQNTVPSGTAGTWSGQGVSGRIFNPGISTQSGAYQSYKVKYNYTNPLSTCSAGDSAFIIVESLPKFKAKAKAYKGPPYYVDFSLENVKYLDVCLWVFGNGETSSSLNPNGIQFNDSGTYTAYVYSTGTCKVYDSVTFTLDYKLLDNDHVSLERSLHVFPNPAHNSLNISLALPADMTLFDMNGRSVAQFQYQAGSMAKWTLPEMSAGVYMISVKTEKGIIWKKIMIE